jgi:serine/threonine protein phosphatase 1
MDKIFAIGDIHGCLGKLERLISNINADPQNDTIVFIGDYIDRGSGGREVVDYVIRLAADYKNVVCLLGNHEYMLLRYLDGQDEEMYLSNGGSATLFDYAISLSATPRERKAKIPRGHLIFFESLLEYYQTDDYFFVHAGLKPGLVLNRQTIHDFLWVRREFIDTDYDFGKMIVFGHTPLSYPLIMPNKIGIDTGAVFGGKLTCVELPAVKIYQV